VYVIVVGGGKVGYFLTRTLMAEGHEVAVLEHRPDVYQKLAADVPDQALLLDGATPEGLAQAGASRADVVVACTGYDEDNLVICQLARLQFGVRRTIARVNNPKNQAVFEALDAGSTVSSTAAIADMIERELDVSPIHQLASLAGGRLRLVELHLPAGARAVGRRIADLALPVESLLVSVLRGDEILLVHGSTVLAADDRVVAVSHPSQVAALHAALIEGPRGVIADAPSPP
jgi:trk system potassium uptake protein TrkA